MYKVAASSGGAGDLVYAIPVMRKLGVRKIYVKRNFYANFNGDLYHSIAPLLRAEGFDVLPTSGDFPIGRFEPGLQFDYNLDEFRQEPFRGKNHIIRSYLNHFRLSDHEWNKPWLTFQADYRTPREDYSLVHVTPRWRDNSKVDWTKVLHDRVGRLYFIGFKEEWREFNISFHAAPMMIDTSDLLEMATLIRDCQALYCNQSVALTIAQGLGKKYFLEVKPGKTNTLMHTTNEIILK